MEVDLEDHEDDEEYDVEEALGTFSAASGIRLTRQQKRELQAISEDMNSGGARGTMTTTGVH